MFDRRLRLAVIIKMTMWFVWMHSGLHSPMNYVADKSLDRSPSINLKRNPFTKNQPIFLHFADFALEDFFIHNTY